MIKFLITWCIPILILLGGVGYVISSHFTQSDKPPNHVAIATDEVALFLTSISNHAKLVVTDMNIRADTSSHLDSDIWDAGVSSWATARVQVFLDLTSFRKDWAQRVGNNLTITIPKSAIQYEVIPTGEGNRNNGSWAFTMLSGVESQLISTNHSALTKQLRANGEDVSMSSQGEVVNQMVALFNAALSQYGIHTTVLVDNNK
jgi:hypothetical protein